MKKMISFCVLLLIVGCKKTSETNRKESIPPATSSEQKVVHTPVEANPSTVEFQDENIDFINYPVDDLEGITSTGTAGVYRNFDFNYKNGETTFILVPKIGAEKWYTQQTKQYKNQDADTMIDKKLSQQSFKDLSKEFNIFIFHIPKKYLKHTPDRDAPYTPQIPRTIFLYKYNSDDNSWNIIEDFIVRNEGKEAKANEWRQDRTYKISTDKPLKTRSYEDKNGSTFTHHVKCDFL
ncbi:hypothetical protein [Chryseobacterium sp. c4a]|uniref:hypothetical protein n=1 Tax=Chryseobacterium sp. c4a TaxID=1573582 RepID=UPI00135B38A2|nr:hypothetical protein [Chryseobacterium sp. c4a]